MRKSDSLTYGFRIVGPCSGERRLVDEAAAFGAYAACDERAAVDREAYLSAFTFDEAFAHHLRSTGTSRGFKGPCGASHLWWDIDREDDLDGAKRDAATLCLRLCDRFALDDDALLVFFSGAKGFHVGLPTALWEPPAGSNFNRIARRFCENLAAEVGVVVDIGVYDKVRAFRAPNSRHPKTGLHKRRLSVEELIHLKTSAILELAGTPEPFEIVAAITRDTDWHSALAWREAAEQVEGETSAARERRATDDASLNRLTLDFIRDGAQKGDRHRLLFSAAANLAELGCPPALAHALLEESALDSGLPPSEVRRQIECGLTHDAGDAP